MAKPNDKGFSPTRRDDDLDSHLANPLPNPDDLKKYEKISPGTAARVLGMAERAQQEHIDRRRWERWARFFSGIASFILSAFSAITSFTLKVFASILDMFKALSKESIRLLARVFAFILALATLVASVFTFIKATSNVDSLVGIAISIAVALAAMLAGRGVYLKVGKLRLRLSSEKKSAGSADSGTSSESAASVASSEAGLSVASVDSGEAGTSVASVASVASREVVTSVVSVDSSDAGTSVVSVASGTSGASVESDESSSKK